MAALAREPAWRAWERQHCDRLALTGTADGVTFPAWPTIPALCALLLVAADYSGRHSSRTPRTPKWPAWSWIAGLICTYGLQLAIIYYAATHEYPMAPWRLTMPLPVVDKPGTDIINGNLVALVMLILAAGQSYALLALYRLRPSLTAVSIGCSVMLVFSLVAPALVSFDLYAYVRYAALGINAYEPTAIPFSAEYRVFDLWRTTPIRAPYGPLWLAVGSAVTSIAPNLISKLLALRTLDVLLYFALLRGLQAAGAPARVRNVVALNPALMLQFVADGHNDLLAIVLLIFGSAAARRRLPLAFALIAVAGLVKLPYALLGLPIVATLRPAQTRMIASLVVVAIVGAVSYAFGGIGYVSALANHVNEYPGTWNLVHQVAAVIALALIVIATAGRRRVRAAVWIIPMLSAAIYSWYFVWALPFALARRRILGYFLVCFPFVTMLVGSAFQRTWQLNILLPLVVAVSIMAGRQPFERLEKRRSDGDSATIGSPRATPEVAR